ncbi:alpha-L-fucosidase [Polaribacter sp.]|uniref:alpha-L-fucosidase n=1 Tax=Polaribacter sp. TaxID=1920175 RepID=UPI0025F11109|nr:alpha-L-fucosidase [Polaribacter sp.]
MNNITKIITLVVVILCCSCKTNIKKEVLPSKKQTVDYSKESNSDYNTRMEWWRNARFGIFIHWGVYSVPAGFHNEKEVKGVSEWIQKRGKIPVSEYEKYAKQFNPEAFNADAWAKLMKDAGMKYVVITSKHHDGFAMWDSKVSNYDIADFSPYKKDILKQLSTACKKEGIKFGLYYSILDWHHPKARYESYLKNRKEDKTPYKENFKIYFEDYMKPQLKEIITNYDPEILWFDGEWIKEFTHEQGKELYQYVRSLKPNIIVNNRVDKGRNGMRGMSKTDNDYAGDFGTPEQEILEKASALDWESCMTMNKSWGFKKSDHNWKSSKHLIHNLIDIVAKGGNYLLNVGPKETGVIPQPSIERLQEMGAWLKINDEAIYGTERLQNNYKQGDNIRLTKKKNKDILYAIILKKPTTTIVLKNIKPNTESSLYLLGHSQSLTWNYTEEKGLEIHIPNDLLNRWSETIYAWTFRINGKEL